MTPENRLNLHPHRAAGSVWDRPGFAGPCRSDARRYVLAAAGGALTLHGLRQRSMLGSLMAGVGGVLLWKTLAGDGRNAWESVRRMTERMLPRQQDPVHDASADSFPASDPPAWTPVKGGTLPGRASRLAFR